jgi:hypothetical protein
VPVGKAKELALAERRAAVLKLYRQGMRQKDIAARLAAEGILPPGAAGEMTVSRDLDAIGGQWAASAERDLAIEKGRLLGLLDEKIEQLNAEWEARPAGRRDPGLIRAVCDVVEKQCRLLGLTKPDDNRLPSSPPVVSFTFIRPDAPATSPRSLVDGPNVSPLPQFACPLPTAGEPEIVTTRPPDPENWDEIELPEPVPNPTATPTETTPDESLAPQTDPPAPAEPAANRPDGPTDERNDVR